MADYTGPINDLLSLIPQPVLAMDRDGTIIGHNRSFLKLFNSSDNLKGGNLINLLWDEVHKRNLAKALKESLESGIDGMTDLALNNRGNEMAARAYIKPSRIGEFDFFILGIRVDLPLEHETAAADNSEILPHEPTRIMDNAADMILTLCKEGRTIWSSAACSRLLGFNRQDMIGKRLDSFAHPADRSAVNQLVSDAFNRDVVHPAIFRMSRRDGSHGWFEANTAPFHRSRGANETVVVCVIRDVTHRRQSEESLLRTERLKAVGEMASGVAHNFNNLLQIVTGGAQLSLTDLEMGDYEQVKSNLKRMLDSARLGSETVRRLQQFARPHTDPSTIEGAVFDLSETVKQAVFMTEPYWRSGPQERSIHVDLFHDLTPNCMVEGKENEVFEVVVNLIRNAVEALPSGGIIQVATKLSPDEVIMTVRDNGVGIPENCLDRVFEPFWTTKGSSGTGIGLASSFGIVAQHGGRIRAHSKLGNGALFDVRFPYSTKAPTSVGESNTVITTTQYNLLIVDDMELVARTLEHGLGRYFNEVHTALNGGEALDIFRTKRIDAIICDLGMPEIDGWEVAETVRNISEQKGASKPPFILLTGLGGQLDRSRDMTARGVDRILEKPADVALLLETITELTNS